MGGSRLMPFALSTFLWPGVIVRLITVSNAALEPALVLLYLLTTWKATVKPRGHLLVAAAGLLGLCALTQITLVCLAPLLLFPVVAGVRSGRRRPAIPATAFALVLPVLLIGPWLASNENRYGALAANSLVERLTGPYESMIHHSGVVAVTSHLWRFGHAALPLEWYAEYRGLVGALMVSLPLALVLLAAIPVLRQPEVLRSRAAGLLGSPLLLGTATLIAIVLLDEWPAALFPRYVSRWSRHSPCSQPGRGCGRGSVEDGSWCSLAPQAWLPLWGGSIWPGPITSPTSERRSAFTRRRRPSAVNPTG